MFRRQKKTTSNNSARRFRPRVESLESRLALAGNVTATLAGSTLILTGNGLSNEILIEGNGAGEFSVTGVATTVNGSANAFTRTNVRNILINLNNGDDIVTIVNADLSGLLSVNGGYGNDELNFGDFNAGIQTFGSVTAIMGAGDDIVEVDGEDELTIVHGFVVNQGAGENTTDLDPDVSLTLGFVSIASGAGPDFVDLGDTVVASGSIIVNSGHGDNLFFFDGDVDVAGNITVIGGNGADEFNPGDTGFDTFDVSGSVVLSLGNGANFVHFEQALETSIGGVLAINTGSGADIIDIDSAEFSVGTLAMNLGAGANEVIFDGGTVTVRHSMAINTLGGNDTFTFIGLDVGGAFALNTGNGNDTVNVDNSIFRGVVAINTFSGNDVINIETTTDDSVGTTFESVVSVNLGAGDDTINLGFDDDDFVTFDSHVTANGSLGTDEIFESGFDVFAFEPRLFSFFP
jgi:hypothetical protein